MQNNTVTSNKLPTYLVILVTILETLLPQAMTYKNQF